MVHTLPNTYHTHSNSQPYINLRRTIRKTPSITVRSSSNGIGDNLLTACVAQGVKEAFGCNVLLQVPGWQLPWMRLFWPEEWLDHEDCPGPLYFCDNSMSIVGELHRLGVPRWKYWADRAGVRATIPPLPLPALPEDATSWAEAHSWVVVIGPYAAHVNRTWPLANWLAVERMLRNDGFITVTIDSVPNRLDAFGRSETSNRAPGYQLTNLHPEQVVALINGASCLVGNDSGMGHVAGVCRIPSVVVSMPASDRGIMGLYPTCTELVDLVSGTITPELVVEAVRKQYSTHTVPGFPTQEFIKGLHLEDQWRRCMWPPLYSVLWETVKSLNPRPRTVVEIGTRAGNGTWTILQAAPECQVATIDLPNGCGEGGAPWAYEHARQLLDTQLVNYYRADSTKLEYLPIRDVDLAYIDGGHDEATAESDIRLALRSGARRILVDDYSACAPVRRAVRRIMEEYPTLGGRFIPSRTGLYLITTAPTTSNK